MGPGCVFELTHVRGQDNSSHTHNAVERSLLEFFNSFVQFLFVDFLTETICELLVAALLRLSVIWSTIVAIVRGGSLSLHV